ncbi:MAG: Enolase [Microgenomates group bacterium GW2011_GWA1_48_10]|nr:MAG: Enolase [Microgenomates group bacterium GW2011_GWA1_48_10]
MKIGSIEAAKSLASLGNETIKVGVTLETGQTATVSLPAGISAGKYEVRSVPADEALGEIQRVQREIVGADWSQESLDEKLVSGHLAGNTTLGISAAFWKAQNRQVVGQTKKFPKLLLLLFEGGKHGNERITMQEFMLVENSLQTAVADFKKIREFLNSQGIESTVGAEGGFSPINFTNLLVLETITAVFPKRDLALDAAGSFKAGEVDYEKILRDYQIISLEDPYGDEDWEKWKELYRKVGDKVLIVGDDLTTTNPERIERAIREKAINVVIIKPNQNGTITGTLAAVRLAREGGLKVIVSHRGEETEDDWIVDFALEVDADFVKFGGMDRGERVAKYNRLLELGME